MFRDRADAGQRLARRLAEYVHRNDVMVMGLLRGGVPVAFEIAQSLHALLDVLLVRKLGAPEEPELAMGAVASGGITILDHGLIRQLALSQHELARAIAIEEQELRRREQLYRDVRPKIEIKGRTVIVADDGIATGASMLAAIAVLRAQGAKKIVAAAPVAPSRVRDAIEKVADGFICLLVSDYFPAVGAFYRDFSQVEDGEVRRLLLRSARLLSGESADLRG